MPVILELGVDLALVLGFVVALGFLYVYRGTLKPALFLFAALFEVVRVGGFGHYARPFGGIASWLRAQAENIDHAIAAMVLATQKGIVLLWHGLAYQAKLLGRLLGDLAETIEHRFHRLLLAFPPALMLWAAVRAAQQLPAIVGNLARARRAALAAAAAIAIPSGWIWRDIRGLRGSLARLRDRVSAQSRHFTRAGAAALVAGALATLGLGWLRCPRVGKVGKRACGMDLGLLESLLADTLIIAGSISLVQYAEEVSAITDEVAGAVREFVRVS